MIRKRSELKWDDDWEHFHCAQDLFVERSVHDFLLLCCHDGMTETKKTLSSHCCARVTQSHNPQSPRWNGAREWSTSIKVSHDTLGSVEREFTASSLTSSQEVDDDDTAVRCVVEEICGKRTEPKTTLSSNFNFVVHFALLILYFIKNRTTKKCVSIKSVFSRQPAAKIDSLKSHFMFASHKYLTQVTSRTHNCSARAFFFLIPRVRVLSCCRCR